MTMRHKLAAIVFATSTFVAMPLRNGWAAQPAQPPAVPPTLSPAPSSGTTPKVTIPPAALQRQMQQLERAQHLLELAAGNDPGSHSAVAARHIQMAINELRLEVAKQAGVAHSEASPKPSGKPTPAAKASHK